MTDCKRSDNKISKVRRVWQKKIRLTEKKFSNVSTLYVFSDVSICKWHIYMFFLTLYTNEMLFELTFEIFLSKKKSQKSVHIYVLLNLAYKWNVLRNPVFKQNVRTVCTKKGPYVQKKTSQDRTKKKCTKKNLSGPYVQKNCQDRMYKKKNFFYTGYWHVSFCRKNSFFCTYGPDTLTCQ